MGVELLDEEQYRHLQTLGEFDTKTSKLDQDARGSPQAGRGAVLRSPLRPVLRVPQRCGLVLLQPGISRAAEGVSGKTHDSRDPCNDGQCQSDCRWPGLPAPYDAALREAVQYFEERYRPWGIVASGTVVRGAPDRTSDLDLCVIHGQPWRQRVQKFFSGVPARNFRLTLQRRCGQYFQRACGGESRSPCDMLATGWVVVARHEVVHTLRREAAQWLEKP